MNYKTTIDGGMWECGSTHAKTHSRLSQLTPGSTHYCGVETQSLMALGTNPTT